MSSNKVFVKDGPRDNHLFIQSVMKPVDAVDFQNRGSIIELYDESSGNFEMDILDENALDKAPMIIENSTATKQPYKKCTRLLTMINLNNLI